jgi:hypothetical protein
VVIQEFVDRYIAAQASLFAEKHPVSYEEVVRTVAEVVNPDLGDGPDPQRVHTIDDGHYQGTLLFVVGATGYQPSDYWYVKVWYGSCSGCDTLQAIGGYEGDPPSEEQAAEYRMLGLHIVQGLKALQDSPV